MRKETYAKKLAALLGIEDKVEVKAPGTTSKHNKLVPVREEDIQHFREAQGLWYFLQAPALFSSKKCSHCGEHFLVSRKYVGLCSYTCIQKSLEEIGIVWRKGEDLEALANGNVYEGNEPIWVRNLDKIREILGA